MGFGVDWQATLMNSINKRKFSLIGHVARSHGLKNDILSGMVNGTQQRGRPRKKLKNDIKDNVGMWRLLRNAQNRYNGRSTIVAATADQAWSIRF